MRVVPLVMLAVFLFAEWLIHVVVLHWRPRRIAGVTVDPAAVAQAPRASRRPARRAAACSSPGSRCCGSLPLAVAIALLAFLQPGARA